MPQTLTESETLEAQLLEGLRRYEKRFHDRPVRQRVALSPKDYAQVIAWFKDRPELTQLL